MNCIDFRRSVGAQPDFASSEVHAHAAQCESCARYRRELLQMDRLIHRALRIDVRAGAPAQNDPRRTRARRWAIAASFLGAVGLGSLLWLASPRASLAVQLVDHVQDEAGSLVITLDRVDAPELAALLNRSGLRLKPGATRVSYAMSCWFRGRYVPHLVVQSASGPVTVMVLQHETRATQPRRFEQEGFVGEIVPAPRGVLAVLGRGVPVDGVADDVLRALEYDEEMVR